MKAKIELGELIAGEAHKDAVHVAICPVIAGENLEPGKGVIINNNKAFNLFGSDEAVGIVDPFLFGMVLKGEKFWLLMGPNQVKNLRHEWDHDAFPDEGPDETELGIARDEIKDLQAKINELENSSEDDNGYNECRGCY